jgi:hypothetical protein
MRLKKIARQAYELGRRQGKRRPIPQPPIPRPAPLPVYLDRESRNELHELAARLARLSISRTDPHRFFEERSELVFALRNLAKGGSVIQPSQIAGGQNRRSGVNIS